MIDTSQSMLELEAATSDLLRKLSLFCGFLGLIVGAIVLLGWALRVDLLTRILPSFAAMNPATAVALMCGGLALLCPLSRKGWARGTGLAVIAIAGIKLAQLFGIVPWRVDQILFSAAIEDMHGASLNRMGPNTAVALFLLGCSILSDTFESKSVQMATQIAAGGAAAISLFTLIGYLLGIAPLFRVQTFNPMALHTAISILILAIGRLIKRPAAIIIILWNQGPAGALARIGLVTVLWRSLVSLCHLGFERQWADAAQI